MPVINKLFSDFGKRSSRKITEDELSQIKITYDNMVWRACCPEQVVSVDAKDFSVFSPTSEMTNNKYLKGKPCLIFTRDQETVQTFLESRKGGKVLGLCLDNLASDEWQIWDETQDIHVSLEAVFREVNWTT